LRIKRIVEARKAGQLFDEELHASVDFFVCEKISQRISISVTQPFNLALAIYLEKQKTGSETVFLAQNRNMLVDMVFRAEF
jgi:hypothetical protein